MHRAGIVVVAFLMILAAGPVALAHTGADPVQIHGYGGWSWGRTDSPENRYLHTSRVGEADYVNLALAFAARSSDHVWINAQVWWEKGQGEEWESVVDYAFGEWRRSDALRLRLGQVKHPFGISTEVFDVGTIRPFFWLAQSIYGPAGVVSESYRGGGLTGAAYLADSWRLEYDAYTGELAFESPGFGSVLDELDAGGDEGDEQAVELNRLYGGRITIAEPDGRIRLGVSAYTARQEDGEQLRHSAVGVLGELAIAGLTIRGEAVHLRESPAVAMTSYYLEAARFLGPVWQIAARTDRARVTVDGLDTDEAPSLLRHLDVTVGLNYWFSDDFVAKLSASWVDGNRFARPDDLGAAIADGGLGTRTSIVSVGVQFAY
jgi:hypothetical protein